MLISAIGLWVLSAQPSEAPPITVKIGDRDVAVALAAGPAPAGPFIEFKGWKYQILPGGDVGKRYLVDGAWGDVLDLRRRWMAHPPAQRRPWRVKATIFTRYEGSYVGRDGIVRPVRLSIEKPEIDAIYQDLARAEVFLEAVSEGVLDVSYDVTVDNAPLFPDQGLGDAPDARVNSEATESDEAKAFGPWDGVVRFAPFDAQAVWPAAARSASPDGVVTQIIQRSLTGSYAPNAYGRFIEPGRFVYLPEAAWRAHGLSTATSGATSDPIKVQGGRVHVQNWIAELFQSANPSAANVGSESEVVFEAPAGAAPKTDAEWLGYASAAAPSKGWEFLKTPQTWGLFAGGQRTDVDAGEVAVATEKGGFRSGGVLLGSGDGAPSGRSLKLSLQQDPSTTYRIDFEDGRGAVLGSVELGAPITARRSVLSVPLEASTAWQTVAIDVERATSGQQAKVRAVVLRPGTDAESLERGTLAPLTVAWHGAEWSDQAGGDLVELAPRASDDAKGAAALALRSQSGSLSPEDIVQANTLLGSKDPCAVLTTLNALSVVEAPDAVPAVIELSKDINAPLAEAAIRCLARQKTPEAVARLRDATIIGPFEHHRRAAAEALAQVAPATAPAAISTLLTAQNWTTRYVGARALCRIGAPDAARVALVFLRDAEPNVRNVVATNLSLDGDLVDRRLLYAAVNDPSEAVRLAAWRRLVPSKLPEVQRDLVRAPRNETEKVAVDLVASWTADLPYAVEGLRIALADPRPSVRAAAIGSGAWGESAKREEFEPLFADKDPRVQSALLRRATASRFVLPDDFLARARASEHPDVRQAVQEYDQP